MNEHEHSVTHLVTILAFKPVGLALSSGVNIGPEEGAKIAPKFRPFFARISTFES